MADGMINVPGLGPTKRTYLYAAGGAVALFVGYAYWRRRRSGSTSVVADSGTGSTGATGGSPPPIDTGGGGSGGSTLPKTNQEWTQDVIDKISVLGGMDAGHLLAVIGKYLQRVPLTTDEADIIRQAWAVAGKPPEGPDTFSLTTSGGSPGQPPPTGKVPAPSGFRRTDTATEGDKVTVEWNPVDGASAYTVHEESKNGSTNFTTKATSFVATVGHGGPNFTHTMWVVSIDANGNASAPSNKINFNL